MLFLACTVFLSQLPKFQSRLPGWYSTAAYVIDWSLTSSHPFRRNQLHWLVGVWSIVQRLFPLKDCWLLIIPCAFYLLFSEGSCLDASNTPSFATLSLLTLTLFFLLFVVVVVPLLWCYNNHGKRKIGHFFCFYCTV